MKKLSLISVAALMLASCSNEDVVPAGEGQEQQVTISLELPAEINSRAMTGMSSASGGLTNVTDEGLTFNVALYSESNTTPVFVGTKTVGVGESVASFTPTVVLGKKYTVVAYASYDESIAWTKATGASTVTPTQVINDEAEDAYFTNQEITASANMKATLTRPYGKIRIIANDYAEALETQFNSTIASVTVTYKDGQATTFSPKAGNFGADKGNAVFTDEAFATNYTDETGGAKTILVDYVPATETGDIVNIESVKVTFVGGEEYTKDLSTLDIPVKRNYLTTLSGDFFTSDANLDLEVDDTLNDGAEINYELALVFQNGGSVTLSEDVTLSAETSLVLAEDLTANVNLGGHTLIVENCNLVSNGNLTISNGKIESTNTEAGRRCIYNYGEMVIDGVEFTQTYDRKGAAINNEGKMTIKDATVDAVYYSIWNSGADAELTIEGGTYKTTNNVEVTDTWSYCVNCINGAKMTINGGEFEGNHGVIAAQSGAEVVLNGGKFHCNAGYTGNSDWTLYADNATILYNSEACEITNANTAGISTTKDGGVVEAMNLVSTQDELNTALAEGGTVFVAAGEYTIPASFANDVVIKGTSKEETIFNMSKSSYAENTSVSFENLTINTPTGLTYNEQAFGFFHRIETLNVENCIINGGLRVNVYGVATIKDCVFNTSVSSGFDGYPLFYYGSTGSKMNVIGCEFNTVSKGIVMYNEGAQVFDLNVEDCKFVASKKDDKAAIQMHTEYGISGTVNIKNTTATGFADVNGGLWNEVNNNTDVPTDKFDITVDGVQVH